jgi:hypothetical protein
MAILGCAFTIISVTHGTGRHIYYVGFINECITLEWNVLSQLAIVPATAVVRISILLLILRIQNSKRWLWAIWFIIALNIVSTIMGEVTIAVKCVPIQADWQPQLAQSAHCMQVESFYAVLYANGGELLHLPKNS